MITRIALKNFKPFGSEGGELNLGLINVFIGENGTGKSSVLQSLALLQQSAYQEKLKEGPFKFSVYSDLVHRGETMRDIDIAIDGNSFTESHFDYRIPFKYEVRLTNPGNVKTQRCVLDVSNVPLLVDDSREKNNICAEYDYEDYQITPENVGTEGVTIKLAATKRILEPIVVSGGTYEAGKKYDRLYDKFSSEVKAVVSILINSIVNNLSVDFSLRGFDEQSYLLTEAPSKSLMQPEEVYSTFAYRREVEERVSQWLSEILDNTLNVHIIPGRQVSLKSGKGFDIYHEGFGVNQLIRPLLKLATSSKDSLIAIEEPEIHLHPRAQLRLCDVLACIAREDKKQILVTTHNEHILSGFLNLVAEHKVSPDELHIHFFELPKNVAKVHRLKVDDKGALDEGLRGFFEVSLENYERHIRALSRKKRT